MLISPQSYTNSLSPLLTSWCNGHQSSSLTSLITCCALVGDGQSVVRVSVDCVDTASRTWHEYVRHIDRNVNSIRVRCSPHDCRSWKTHIIFASNVDGVREKQWIRL